MEKESKFESSKHKSSSAYFLKALLVFASERGADIETICKSIDLDVNILASEQARIPLNRINHLWCRIEAALNDPFIGLHFGLSFGKHAEGHFLFTIMKNSETFKDALNSFIRYHCLITDIVKPVYSITDRKIYLELENRFNNIPITRHISEAVLSLMATVFRKITFEEIVLEKIYFIHSATGNLTEYMKVFGKEPVFNSDKNCIVFDESALSYTFPLAHHEFGTRLRDYAEKLENQLYISKKYNEKILLLLENKIHNGDDCSLAAVAEIFNMSIRHLQDKLKEEGFTYQILLDKARKGIALHYIQNEEVMFCDIAFLLGFSEQSSFNHAFKKWTGLTPREYKETVTGRSEATAAQKIPKT